MERFGLYLRGLRRPSGTEKWHYLSDLNRVHEDVPL